MTRWTALASCGASAGFPGSRLWSTMTPSSLSMTCALAPKSTGSRAGPWRSAGHPHRAGRPAYSPPAGSSRPPAAWSAPRFPWSRPATRPGRSRPVAADPAAPGDRVRGVKRLNPKTAPQGQDELFSVYRYHAVFTDSTEPMLIAEAHHRDHAIVEQVIADLKSSALEHFPSGSFNANGAWLACAVMAYNLSRAAGVLAGGKLGKARTTTIRTTLINIPARLAFSAGSYTLHLPANSRRERPFLTMFDNVQAPPKAA